MKDDPALLRAMFKDLSLQYRQYQPGPYWEEYSRRIAHAIIQDGIKAFRSNYTLSKGLADAPLLDPSTLWRGLGWKKSLLRRLANSRALHSTLIKPYLRAINFQYRQMNRYRQKYYESRFGEWLASSILVGEDCIDTLAGGCRDYLDLNGRHVAVTYVRQLMRIHNFSSKVDFQRVKSVVEIGGGFGANAHLLLTMFPSIRKYLYIDLPPMLYIGTQYLRHFFREQVIDYLRTRGKTHVSFADNDDREIIAACPWQIGSLEIEMDLFWNSASFQEMEASTISNYLSWLSRLQGRGTSCLIIYRGGTPKTTRTVEEIITLADKYLETSILEPEIEDLPAPVYLLGFRRPAIGKD